MTSESGRNLDQEINNFKKTKKIIKLKAYRKDHLGQEIYFPQDEFHGQNWLRNFMVMAMVLVLALMVVVMVMMTAVKMALRTNVRVACFLTRTTPN